MIRFLIIMAGICMAVYACDTEDAIEGPSQDTWKTYTNAGLGECTVYAITQDAEGTLWAGTEGNGIYQFKNDSWKVLKASSSTFLDNSIYCIAQDPAGNIYVGSSKGISRFDGSTWTRQLISSPVISGCYYLPTKEMVFGTAGTGFVLYSNNEYGEWAFNDTEMNYINAIYADSKAWLWFGTQNGLMRMSALYKFTKFTTANGLAANYVYSFFEDRNNRLWIGFWGGKKIQWVENGYFHDIQLMSGFDNNYILSFADDMFGNLWFGAISSGAFKYNGSIMEPFGINDGLCDNTIVSVFRDKDNTLWFGGLEGGISRLKQAVPINK
ncbi:MAG: two-component regulator propeller domain-containing protein [Bacteroidales bacterium]